MGGLGGILKLVVLVILEEIPEWCVRQYRGWCIIFQAPKKWILFKAKKRIQVLGHIHCKRILFFRVSLGYLNFKLF